MMMMMATMIMMIIYIHLYTYIYIYIGREQVIVKNVKREESKKSSSMSDDFGRNAIDESDDEDLMKALEQQMGANNMKVLISIYRLYITFLLQ
jgi:hypothetical protein